ncbi:hypothetical protein HYX19_00015 [Candidatus Woesearchaeota archaeon]|nr:hypothetical protein [Candidatus Woesearchaeota archaeon]
MVLKKRKRRKNSTGRVWIISVLILIIIVSVIGYGYIQYKKNSNMSNSFETIYYGLKDKKLNDQDKNNLINRLDTKFKNECENNKCSIREVYFYVSSQQKLNVSDAILLQKESLKNFMMENYKDSFDISNEISEDTFFTIVLMHRLEQFRKTQVEFWRLKLTNNQYNDLFNRFKQALLLRTLSNGVSTYDQIEKIDSQIDTETLKKNICNDIPSYNSILSTEAVNNPDDNALAPVYNYAYIKSFCKSSFNDNDKALFDKIANKDYPTVYGSIQKDIIINIGIKGLF